MILRRIRALVVSAGLWFLAWLPVGVGLGIWMYATFPAPGMYVGGRPVPPTVLPIVGAIALACSLWGAMSGVVFAILLMGAERAHPIQHLSRVRAVLWGGMAGACLPVVLILVNLGQWDWGWGTLLPLGLGMAVGSGCALTAVVLAQRGHADVAA